MNMYFTTAGNWKREDNVLLLGDKIFLDDYIVKRGRYKMCWRSFVSVMPIKTCGKFFTYNFKLILWTNIHTRLHTFRWPHYEVVFYDGNR
jgi:hypothetical protein